MSNLTPLASWDAVIQLEGTMSAVPSTWNTPNQALLNRTEWLKQSGIFADGLGNVSIGATKPAPSARPFAVANPTDSGANPWTTAHHSLDDTRAMAAGVGGTMQFTGRFNSAGDYSSLAWIRGSKVTGTSGDPSGNLLLGARGGAVQFFTQSVPVIDGMQPLAEVPLSGGFLSYSGVIGYGTGSGGTVTQATSKATAVTLNKPAGQITTHNAALAAGALVSFTVNCSLIDADDVPRITLKGGNATAGTYRVWTEAVAAGSFVVCIENRSAGSLSEALVLNFVVIKGANA